MLIFIYFFRICRVRTSNNGSPDRCFRRFSSAPTTNGLQYLNLCLSASFPVLSGSLFTNHRLVLCLCMCIPCVSQCHKILNKWIRRRQKLVISVEKSPVCLSGLSGMSTVTVKLSQAVIIGSASCSGLKICEFSHAVFLCVSSILAANSEYLRDTNNRQVFVMGTENKTFNTVSVSRANKRRLSVCAVDTAAAWPAGSLDCLLCRALWHWWHMSAGCVQVTLPTIWPADVTYGVPAGAHFDGQTGIQFVLADQYDLILTGS